MQRPLRALEQRDCTWNKGRGGLFLDLLVSGGCTPPLYDVILIFFIVTTLATHIIILDHMEERSFLRAVQVRTVLVPLQKQWQPPIPQAIR
jgi:hypothetical protein